MNSKTRLKILEMSLILEDTLNRILVKLFRIKKDSPNTLGHKSSSISFKTKVDFLYDLDRIDKKTHTDLVTLMEIRNQFMHNLSAETYTIVLNRLNKEKYIASLAVELTDKNKKYNVPIDDCEGIYEYGISKLYLNISNSLSEVVEKINTEVDEERKSAATNEAYASLVKISDESLDEFAMEFNAYWSKESMSESEMGKLIVGIIRKKIENKVNEKYQIE